MKRALDSVVSAGENYNRSVVCDLDHAEGQARSKAFAKRRRQEAEVGLKAEHDAQQEPKQVPEDEQEKQKDEAFAELNEPILAQLSSEAGPENAGQAKVFRKVIQVLFKNTGNYKTYCREQINSKLADFQLHLLRQHYARQWDQDCARIAGRPFLWRILKTFTGCMSLNAIASMGISSGITRNTL